MNRTFSDADRPHAVNKLKRRAAFVIGILLMFVSAFFNIKGIHFVNESYNIVSWIMAVSIIVIQLVWNSENVRENMTLLFVGLFAYAYGMGTNITGILEAMGVTLEVFKANPLTAIIPVIFGIAIEVAPEPILIWAVLGKTNGEGDFIKNIVHVFNKKSNAASVRRPETPTSYRPTSTRPPQDPTVFHAVDPVARRLNELRAMREKMDAEK